MFRFALVLTALPLLGCQTELERLDELGEVLEGVDGWSTAPAAPAPAPPPSASEWGGGDFPYHDQVRWEAPTTGLMWGDLPALSALDAETVSADLNVRFDPYEGDVMLDFRFTVSNDDGDEAVLMGTKRMWEEPRLLPDTFLLLDTDQVALVIDEDGSVSETWEPTSALIDVEERAPGVLRLTVFTEFQRFGRVVAAVEVVPD